MSSVEPPGDEGEAPPDPDHLARLDEIREAAGSNWLVALADDDLAAACWAAGEVRRLQAEVADREADAEGFRQLALTADEEIARISAVAGSLFYALLAIRRMHSSGQFDDKGGPAMVDQALGVAERAGIEAGENPYTVNRRNNTEEHTS